MQTNPIDRGKSESPQSESRSNKIRIMDLNEQLIGVRQISMCYISSFGMTETVTMPTDVVSIISEATPSQCEILDRIVTAAEETDVSQYVELEIMDNRDELVVTLRSDESIHNEGETGLDTAHVIIGKRGGVNRAEITSNYGDDRPFDSWDRFVPAVGRMC